jgi:hypothetical protein
LILAIIGGVFGGICVLYAFFWMIAESYGWALRRYGATPMWRFKSKKEAK